MNAGGKHKRVDTSTPRQIQASCTLIIMHPLSFGQSLIREYYESGVLPLHIRPRCCWHCNAQCRFHRHSRYMRKCVFLLTGWLTPFFIQRFKCSACGKVFSLIPESLYKWQRLDLALLQEFLSGKQCKSVRENFSVRTLWRWKARWRERVESQRAKILQILLSFKPDLNIDVPISKASSTLSYLLELCSNMPRETPSLIQLASMLHYCTALSGPIPHKMSSSLERRPEVQ